MTDSLERRLRQLRSRVLARAWGYRQHGHAGGVWFRLRRALTDAREAYAISRQAAEELIAEGYQAEPVGRELEPPRLIIFVPSTRVARIPSARPLEVRLSAELLTAECLALVPFGIEPGPR